MILETQIAQLASALPRQPMITQSGKTSAEPKKNPRERLLLIPPKRKMEPRLRLRQNHGQKRKGYTLGKLFPMTLVIRMYCHFPIN
jgi:hypothetical protein